MRGQLTLGTVLRTYEAALNDPDALIDEKEPDL
jgi:hypothetical protein